MDQKESVKKEPAGLAADAAEAPSPEEAFRIIEACLFAAGHPLPLQKLAELCSMTPTAVKKLCEAHLSDYEGRGIQLLILQDFCQLVTKEAYREYIRAALGIAPIRSSRCWKRGSSLRKGGWMPPGARCFTVPRRPF